jgi:FtsH-binding integral membrane protein
MSYAMEYNPGAVSQAPADVRAAFIRRTYAHLAGAVLAFIAIEYVLLNLPGIERLVETLMLGGQLGWLLVIGGFMVVSYIANMWAQSDTSPGLQYAGLALYVAAQSVIFLPLLYIANTFYPGTIASAGIMSGAVFAGLTLAVVLTGKDFSFLGPIIAIGGLLALGFIIAGAVFGFTLGNFFCFAMVGLASASIIYNTSNIMHRYNYTQHVAAALALFASVATLFYYILILAMRGGRD